MLARYVVVVVSTVALGVVQWPTSVPLTAAQLPVDGSIAPLPEPALLTALTERLTTQSKEDQFSGAVMISRQGRVIHESAWGLANRERGERNTTRTKFRLGSLNKSFTAVAVLRLVEAGRLELDAPISRYLKDYPSTATASKVTIRHLLTHSGGTGDFFGPEFTRERTNLREHADYLRLFGARDPAFEPGSRFAYSNYGYILLGAIIERVTGQSYYDHVRTSVFERAGMRDTASLSESEVVANRSAGYTRRGESWVSNADSLPWRGTAAGGGYSTVHDLVAFGQALEQGKLLSAAMLKTATTPERNNYAMGFMLRGEGKHRAYGHGGGAPGMNAELRIVPGQGYVFAAISNFDPPAATRMMDFFLRRLPE